MIPEDVARALRELGYSTEEARRWAASAHRQLRGRTPEQALADGDGDEVRSVLAQLLEGAFG